MEKPESGYFTSLNMPYTPDTSRYRTGCHDFVCPGQEYVIGMYAAVPDGAPP
jgi:hypothetical protein